jgi:hypothetical protein
MFYFFSLVGYFTLFDTQDLAMYQIQLIQQLIDVYIIKLPLKQKLSFNVLISMYSIIGETF